MRTLTPSTTCPVCMKLRPKSDFSRLSEPSPTRKARRKRIIDVTICKHCRRQQVEKALKAEEQAALAKAHRKALYYSHVVKPYEVPDAMRPTPIQAKHYNRNVDPVLAYCTMVRINARAKIKALRAKVITPRYQCKEGVSALRWQRVVHQARIWFADQISAARRLDLKSYVTASDPQRANWTAYVTQEMREVLTEATSKANAVRWPPMSRRMVVFPQYQIHLSNTDTIAQAWAEFIGQAQFTAKKTRNYTKLARMRKRKDNKYRMREKGAKEYTVFTMAEFHDLRGLAARNALETINEHIAARRLPTQCDPIVREWKDVVDFSARARIETMYEWLPENVKARMKCWPTMTLERSRTRWQRKHGLDKNNVPLPHKPPAMRKATDMPAMEKVLDSKSPMNYDIEQTE